MRVPRRPVRGALLFTGAAVGGAALGFLAERRAVSERHDSDPEWARLRARPPGRETTVSAADGTALAVRVAGPADGPTIVLAHSYAMTSELWLYQLRDLHGEFRVVAYDLRGHGRSAPAAGGDYSMAAHGRDLRDVIAAVAGGRPVLVAGHSLGGMAIMAYALAHPEEVAERLAGAALLNTASSRLLWRGLLSAGAAAVGGVGRLVGSRGPLPPASDLTYLITRALALEGQASPAHAAFVEHRFLACDADVLVAVARTLSTVDLDAALADLAVPTLVIAGTGDRLTPVRQARELAAALPDACLVELPAGHFAPLEAHESVSDRLRAHGRAVLPGAGGARARGAG